MNTQNSNYHHHHHHHHEHGNCGRARGAIKRVTQGLADKFGISRKVVTIGFIIGLFVNLPLTVIVFFAALYWVKNPGKLEQKFDKTAAKVRDSIYRSSAQYRQQQYAYADASMSDGNDGSDQPYEDQYEDADFDGLRRQFDDLERRAADMEEHVASDEYTLNSEFRKMKDDK